MEEITVKSNSSGRNRKRLPGGEIIRINVNDHYKKLNKKVMAHPRI